jgi:hypothetical protein
MRISTHITENSFNTSDVAFTPALLERGGGKPFKNNTCAGRRGSTAFIAH